MKKYWSLPKGLWGSELCTAILHHEASILKMLKTLLSMRFSVTFLFNSDFLQTHECSVFQELWILTAVFRHTPRVYASRLRLQLAPPQDAVSEVKKLYSSADHVELVSHSQTIATFQRKNSAAILCALLRRISTDWALLAQIWSFASKTLNSCYRWF